MYSFGYNFRYYRPAWENRIELLQRNQNTPLSAFSFDIQCFVVVLHAIKILLESSAKFRIVCRYHVIRIYTSNHIRTYLRTFKIVIYCTKNLVAN